MFPKLVDRFIVARFSHQLSLQVVFSFVHPSSPPLSHNCSPLTPPPSLPSSLSFSALVSPSDCPGGRRALWARGEDGGEKMAMTVCRAGGR